MNTIPYRNTMLLRGRVALQALAVLCFLLCCASARAQALYGTLQGLVADASGAAIPRASVTVRNQGTGETRMVPADEHGNYIVRALEPGVYAVDVAPTGSFGAFKQENVRVEANQNIRVNAVLQPGNVESVVTVSSGAQLLQTESAEVNHQLSEAQIEQLPVGGSQGRNFQSLYTLIPGASAVSEQNSSSANPSRAQAVNFNGASNTGNTTRIDGAIDTYGWLPYLIAYVPPADSIQNVNVVTNSFNAEQGLAGGASINVIVKSGTNQLHGSLWEYNQIANTNARSYTTTVQAQPQLPKNIFNQYGFTIGGPVVFPKLFNGRNKLFFFQAFERTTRRQLVTGNQTVPDLAMLGGDFSEVQSGLSSSALAVLYDPQPGGVRQTGANAVNGYLAARNRPTFLSEYGCNCIPASRLSPAAVRMLALLQPISKTVGTPTTASLNAQLANNYSASGNLINNRITTDTKINYNASDNTTFFARYSGEPFSIIDPTGLGQAGGNTLDGGQAGVTGGRIQNVGFGFTHVITPNLLIDADGGYTRQRSGVSSPLDQSLGNFGLDTLGIPGTNGLGTLYAGQPAFVFTGFSSLGGVNGTNPFLFRDNQFTGDVNLSWVKHQHSMKYGFTYYHFGLNHFQPSGSSVNNPRGYFRFQGGLTNGTAGTVNAYYSLADFLLGLPNFGTGTAVSRSNQLNDPNSLRWTDLGFYAQDQWTVNPKLTLSYGLRYEYYPPAYRDHSGIYRLDPSLPQSANIVIGGLGGNPQDTGLHVGHGMVVPRFGINYRVNDHLVVRSGGGITSDPDNMRFLRDTFPEDINPNYTGASANSIALDSAGNPITLATGIPAVTLPNINSGFASLPISGSTNTLPMDYRRGYIESWNFFVQQDLGAKFVLNAGYVGTHQVRQLVSYTLNSAPLPSGSTVCMANGQFNPSSPYYTRALGSNPCNFAANEAINFGVSCPSGTASNNLGTCYNTGGIYMNRPLVSSSYNGLQTQLTRNAGRSSQFGLIYTWSRAINFNDNGADSGASVRLDYSYPDYIGRNRATAGYNRTNNLQFYGIYQLPFGRGQRFLQHGAAALIFGGYQINGQVSRVSGAPFSVSPSASAINAPGNTSYAQQVAPYVQLGGHNRTPGNGDVSGGLPWFDPTSFTNPTQPTYTATQAPNTIQSPVFSNTHRNQFTGPGTTNVNASLFRRFHIYRQSEFQVRVEAFNLFNHPQPGNPNTTVGGGSFGYITSFGAARVLQYSGRLTF